VSIPSCSADSARTAITQLPDLGSLLQDGAYARVNLNGGRLAAFDAVYTYVTGELPPPVLIIHLQCPPEEELRRIQSRARSEEKPIELAYLDTLNKAIAHAVDEIRAHIPVLKIDSAVLDFAKDPEIQRRVVSDILLAVGRG
jgi:deoxyadenosine/deoxycytidine kinase